jgi:putative acyl-CoA dehydrogenase
VAQAAGADRRLDAAAADLTARLAEPDDRRPGPVAGGADGAGVAGRLLVRYAPAPVADAFCATRLAGDWATRSERCRAGWTGGDRAPGRTR